MTKREIVLVWVFRAIEDFYFAFPLEYGCRFGPFFEAMGLEMMLKAYFLAENACKFENLPENEQKKSVDEVAKALNHRLEALVGTVKKNAPALGFADLLRQDFDGYTGMKMLRALEAAYIECRYPVPTPFHEKTPLHGKDRKRVKSLYEDPISSSGVTKFAYAASRLLLKEIKTTHEIALPRGYLEKLAPGKDGERFCNLFFDGRIAEFVTEED